MKPPIGYFGSKGRIAPKIAALLPEHEHYVEPFAGSFAVLFAKRPSPMETANDIDGNLMAFWKTLRERPAELERACALTPHSRAEHEAAFALDGDELERARKVWVLLTQGRGGHLPPKRSGWRHYQDPRGSAASMPRYLGAYLGRMAGAVERLMNVSLECRPAGEVIGRYGRHEGVLLYCDPPYLASVRTLNHGRGRGPDYAHELRADRHYNRQKIGAEQFVPPGRCLVLKTSDGTAAWITSWPFAEYVQHARAGAWVNSLFRNEGGYLSSDLIRWAVAHTRARWPEVPELGIVSFVDASKTAPKEVPGWCYRRAGWSHVGFTQAGLYAFQQLPGAVPQVDGHSHPWFRKPMPEAVPVPGWQPSLFDLEAS